MQPSIDGAGDVDGGEVRDAALADMGVGSSPDGSIGPTRHDAGGRDASTADVALEDAEADAATCVGAPDAARLHRASKAALNALVKSFSIDVGDVTFLLLHPGRVETGLVGWKEEGAMSVGESLETCLKAIEGCGKGDSGTFVDRFGEVIAW